MKIILTSAIIAFCGVLQIAANDATMLEMRYELIEKELTLVNVTGQLLNLQKDLTAPENTIDTSTEFKANLTTFVNNATRTIEDKGQAAVANGKSVGVCVEPALANLTALKKTAFAEYTQAGANITHFTADLLRQIDDTLKFGVTVGTKVFAIPTICYNNDTDIFAACFADSLKNATEGIEAYRTAVNNVSAAAESETSLSSFLGLVVEWVFAILIISEEAETGIETIQKTAIECIEAL